MTIFVSIASYCDPLLGFTIARALETASDPDGLRFGIIDQSEAPMSGAPARYRHVPAATARGPCWARAQAMQLYQGEDWFLQIDSHTDFDSGWDERLIGQARGLGERSVITAYPNGLEFSDGKPVHKITTDKVLALVLAKGAAFEAGKAMLMFVSHAVDSDEAVPAISVGACCLFAAGTFVGAFPYDPNLYFYGEEQSVFLRLYTHGWDVFHVPGVPIYHAFKHAADGLPARPLHWDPDQDAKRAIKWRERERLSQQRLLDLVSGRVTGDFGLGKARSLADYAALSGIDYERRTIEPRAYSPAVRSASISF